MVANLFSDNGRRLVEFFNSTGDEGDIPLLKKGDKFCLSAVAAFFCRVIQERIDTYVRNNGKHTTWNILHSTYSTFCQIIFQKNTTEKNYDSMNLAAYVKGVGTCLLETLPGFVFKFISCVCPVGW